MLLPGRHFQRTLKPAYLSGPLAIALVIEFGEFVWVLGQVISKPGRHFHFSRPAASTDASHAAKNEPAYVSGE